MIILILLLLLTNLHLKLLSTQGTGADKLLSTQRVKKEKNRKKITDLNHASPAAINALLEQVDLYPGCFTFTLNV